MARDIKATLDALSTSAERPVSRRVAELLPAIEAAIAAGVSRRQIVQVLRDDGIPIDLRQLDTYLYRLRRRQRPVGQVAAAAPAPAVSAPGSHDPKVLSAIMGQRPNLEEYARIARAHRKGRTIK